MKIGDTVRFLKEVGGGRVSGFPDKNTVLVEDNDGFEIPMPINEVVVVGGESYDGGTWDKAKAKAKAQLATQKPASDSEPKQPKSSGSESGLQSAAPERRGGEKLNVYLAFVPTTPDNMVDTTFEAYIINDSNYFITLTWLSAQGNAWRARFGGTLEPNTKEFIEEINRRQIDEIARVALQLIAYKREKTFDIKPAISVEMRIDGTKFYKAGAFKQTFFFEESVLLIDAVKDDAPVRSIFADAGQIREALMGSKPENEPKRPAQATMQNKNGNEIEVNLHDYALFDSKEGLTNADILNRQMLEVRNTMEKYKNKKGTRIVFIHGKGDGVLRAKLLRELKHRYPACRTQDASFQEYGFGATLVTIA
jgi:hypothetical protein